MNDRGTIGAIFAGGVLGSLARAGVGEALAHGGPGWPWATFAVNVVGAFLLGWFATQPPSGWRPFLTTGFCGALTTFAALQLELLRMLDAERFGVAAAYAAASIAAGLAAVWVAGRRRA